VKAARTAPVPRPAAALSPAPQRAPPPPAPAPSYGATLRMDTEPPARTTRHGLLIR